MENTFKWNQQIWKNLLYNMYYNVQALVAISSQCHLATFCHEEPTIDTIGLSGTPILKSFRYPIKIRSHRSRGLIWSEMAKEDNTSCNKFDQSSLKLSLNRSSMVEIINRAQSQKFRGVTKDGYHLINMALIIQNYYPRALVRSSW